MVSEEDIKVGTIKSDEANSQIYFTNCPTYVNYLVKAKKGIVYYNEGFIYGLFGDKSLVDEKQFKAFCESFKGEGKEKGETKFKYAVQEKLTVGKKNVIKDIYQISCFTTFNVKDVQKKFEELGFKEIV